MLFKILPESNTSHIVPTVLTAGRANEVVKTNIIHKLKESFKNSKHTHILHTGRKPKMVFALKINETCSVINIIAHRAKSERVSTINHVSSRTNARWGRELRVTAQYWSTHPILHTQSTKLLSKIHGLATFLRNVCVMFDRLWYKSIVK